MEKQTGTLYLCATPIGNLEDMTYRAVRVLGEVGRIAAEDTRHTRKLLTHFDLHTPLVSYHEHNKFEKGPECVAYLLEGNDLAIVSDAGFPGIADPGSHLVSLAIAEGIPVVPLPGANAALSALVCSGIDTTVFTFVGFLPKTTKKRGELLAALEKREETLIFYESPHRLKPMLKELCNAFGPLRPAVAARELTKKFEEFVRGTLEELRAHFDANDPRGEFCIVVAGREDAPNQGTACEQIAPEDLVRQLVANGADKKAAIKEAAVRLGLPKRDVYQAVLAAEDKA